MRRVVAVGLLLSLSGVWAGAQEPLTLGEWIDEYNVHRIAGYATLGLAATAGTLGLLEVLGVPNVDVHPALGYATVSLTALTGVTGMIAYYDRAFYAWPHWLLNGIAAAGFALNALLLDGGSPAHIASGAVAVVSASAALLYLRLRLR